MTDNKKFLELPDPKDSTIQFYDEVCVESVATAIACINDYEDLIAEWERTAAPVLKELGFSLHREEKPITLQLTTYGGSVYDGMAFYDTVKGRNVNCVASGYVMSAGIFIMLGCKHRAAYRNTTFMIHSVASAYEGKVDEVQRMLEQDKRLNDIIDKIILKETKITEAQLANMHKNLNDWFLTAEEALELGLIHEIVE